MRASTRILITVLALATLGAAGWLASRPGAPGDPGPTDDRAAPEDPDRPSGPDPATTGLDASGETTEPAANREPLVVHVTDWGGTPVAGATVLAIQDGEEAARGTTDATGRVAFAAPGGPGQIATGRIGSAPHAVSASLDPGRIDVILPLGLEISGKLLVDDTLPTDPVRLELWGRSGFPEIADLAPAVRAVPGFGEALAATKPDGSFRFTGLPESWAGYLTVPRDFELVDPPGNGICFEVAAPRSDLIVRIRRLPTITGRVVLAEKKTPVPGAIVLFEYRTSTGAGSQGVLAGTDGRFVVPVRRIGITSMSLTVSDADGDGRVHMKIVPSRLEARLELGDVELTPMRYIALEVRSPDGRPVEGAVVRGDENRVVKAEPTDAQGLTMVVCESTMSRLRVAARGTAVVEASLPPQGEVSPIRIVLPPGCMIAIRVEEPDGRPASGVLVRIRANGLLFGGGDGTVDPVFAATAHGSMGSLSTSVRGTHAGYQPDREGRVDLAGILPDVPVEITVTDRSGGTVLAAAKATGLAARTEEVVVRLPRSGSLTVNVVDREGRPIAEASVRLGRLVTPSQEDGDAQFRRLRATRDRLEVTKAGYVPYVDPEVEIPEEGGEVRIELAPGRTVRLEISDSDGRPVSGADISLEEHDMGSGYHVPADGPGSYRLRDLPEGTVKIVVAMGNLRFALPHPTSERVARLRVPATGAFRIVIPLELGRRTNRVRLVPVGFEADDPSADIDLMFGMNKFEAELTHVLPGRYRVLLEAMDDETDELHLVREAPAITVVAGRKTEIVLDG